MCLKGVTSLESRDEESLAQKSRALPNRAQARASKGWAPTPTVPSLRPVPNAHPSPTAAGRC